MPRRNHQEFEATLERSDNRLWGAHLRVPRAVADGLVTASSRRVVRTLNGSAEHQCALLPAGNGSFVISVNKKWRDTLHLDIGARVAVTLRSDASAYGLPMPEELAELLRQDRSGNRLFHALSAGKQRTLIYIVGNVKNPEARAFRAATILRHLHEMKGTIAYKRLSQSLKRRHAIDAPAPVR
jgi:hypothetical protein